MTRLIRFALSNFTYLLTLFSKFFSSFPHGTCSLSVYCLYLALDGIYHPLWAEFPNSPTRRRRTVHGAGTRSTYGIVTLYDPVFQQSSPRAAAGFAPLDYNSTDEARQADFQLELLPLHSQLLGESVLVSFPPLINMLKFSGFSYLISGPIVRLDGGTGRHAGIGGSTWVCDAGLSVRRGRINTARAGRGAQLATRLGRGFA